LKSEWCNVVLLSVDEGVDQALLDSVMMPTDKSPVSVTASQFYVDFILTVWPPV